MPGADSTAAQTSPCQPCRAPAVSGNTTTLTPALSPRPYLVVQAAGLSRRRRCRPPGAEQAADTQQAGGSH